MRQQPGTSNVLSHRPEDKPMNRRGFFMSAAVALFSLSTGCLDGDEDAEDGDGNQGENDEAEGNETDEKDEVDNRDDPSASFVGAEFEVLDDKSGTRGDEVSIAFDEENLTATVEGSVFGRNSCYTAGLGGSEYDKEDASLLLSIETFDNSDEREVCMQVITEIGYRTVATFENELPRRVTVEHDGDRVTEASGRIQRDTQNPGNGNGTRNRNTTE